MQASAPSVTPGLTLNQFFSASEARNDRWRTLNRVARGLAAGGPGADKLRAEFTSVLDEVTPLEDFNGYPGPHLMGHVQERLKTGDWTGLARLVQRIGGALLANSYRDDVATWSADEESEAQLPDILPPAVGRGQARRPYFEVLSVTATDPVHYEQVRQDLRRLRRADDPFVYELIQVGSLEDAIVAVLANPELQAIVIGDGAPAEEAQMIGWVHDRGEQMFVALT